jgi:osmotically-inducible protein OsmY
MDKLVSEKGYSSRGVVGYLPETDYGAEMLAATVKRAVQRETNGVIRDLSVDVLEGCVVLKGRCHSYYTKQRAQHAAMAMALGEQIINCIEVR